MTPPTVPAVLVVDDDGMLREMYRTMLERAGYAVELAADAFEAMGVLEDPDRPVGTVLTDIQMPGMSGLELLDWLFDHHPRLPAVLMTGHLAELPVDGPYASVPLLTKPFPRTELLGAIGEAMGRVRSTGGSPGP